VDALWVDTQSRTIGLHESPQYVLCRFVDVGATGILRKVPLQWDLQNGVSSRLHKRSRAVCAFGSLLRNTSILFMNKIIEVRKNHRELMIESNSSRDSAMRFCGENNENLRARQSTHRTHLASLFE
jgi:hypothetical protein